MRPPPLHHPQPTTCPHVVLLLPNFFFDSISIHTSHHIASRTLYNYTSTTDSRYHSCFRCYPCLLTCPSCTGRTRHHDITNREDTTTIVPSDTHIPLATYLMIYAPHIHFTIPRDDRLRSTNTTYAYALCFTLYAAHLPHTHTPF